MDTRTVDAKAVGTNASEQRTGALALTQAPMRWWLFWVGIGAFVVMAGTLVIVSSLPPFPANVPIWAFIVIMLALLATLGCLVTFSMEFADWDMRRPQ